MERESRRINWQWIGARIREARERRRWTQTRLGQEVGLSQQAISAIEQGQGSGYRLATYWAIREVLDIPWTTLVGNQAQPPPADMPPPPPGTQDPQAVLVSVLGSFLIW